MALALLTHHAVFPAHNFVNSSFINSSSNFPYLNCLLLLLATWLSKCFLISRPFHIIFFKAWKVFYHILHMASTYCLSISKNNLLLRCSS